MDNLHKRLLEYGVKLADDAFDSEDKRYGGACNHGYFVGFVAAINLLLPLFQVLNQIRMEWNEHEYSTLVNIAYEQTLKDLEGKLGD